MKKQLTKKIVFNKKKWLYLSVILLTGLSRVLALSDSQVPAGQLPYNIKPVHYQLELTLNPEETRFSGKVNIDIQISEKVDVFYIHGRELNITSDHLLDDKNNQIEIDIKTTTNQGVLKVIPSKTLYPGSYTINITYDAPFNENLQGLHRVKDSGFYHAFTQMESIYARYAFPSFDEPRFKTTYDLSLNIPEKLTAISNTPEKKNSKTSKGWKRVQFETTKPMPTYLVAMAVGHFDVVKWTDLPATDVRKTPIPLRGIAIKGKGKKLEYALKNTQAIIEALEDYFQIPYPYKKLDLLAVPDFAAGAMENPGAITYREQLLLLDENASIHQKRSYKSVHAHELAHQWFGNLVTPVWWNDIWLNEAFATWMASTALHRQWPDQQWRRRLISDSRYAMGADSIPSARKIRNPILSDGDIITAFDGITYSKGGGVLSMIESFMGEQNFQLGVQKYMKKYQWKNADAIDFFNSIASVLPEEKAKLVIQSFKDFVEQAGVPELDIQISCNHNQTQLEIHQQRYSPPGTHFKEKTKWNIPACFRYAINGKEKRQCEIISQEKQKVLLSSPGCISWIVPNLNAAGYYRFNLDSVNWKNAINHLNQLSAVEASAVVDSMTAAFESGKITIKELISIIPATLKSKSWEIIVSGLNTFEMLIDYAETAEKEKLRQIAADLFKHKADSLGFSNDTQFDKEHPLDASSLRYYLVRFMAMIVKDPGYREALQQKARKYVGYKGDNKIHEEAIVPTLALLAMQVAVQDLKKPYVKLLLKHLESTRDGTLRGRLVRATGATQSPEIATQLRELTLSSELKDNEKSRLIYSLNTEKKLDAVMWPWFKNNFSRLVADMPTNYQSSVPYLFTANCNQINSKRLETFLKPRLNDLTGADRNFVKAKDYLKQCQAQKSQLKPQITRLINSTSTPSTRQVSAVR